MLESLSLDGKTVLVTGGGTGLGKEMVLAMARAGANIVVAARRHNYIEEAANQVRSMGRKALAVTTDVTDSAQVNNMVQQAVNEFGKIDVLINNAGGGVGGLGSRPIWEITDEQWRIGIDVNLTSAFYCSRAVAKDMVERRSGKIINIASGTGLRGVTDTYAYGAAKGGIISLTRVLAVTLSRHGISATCISPGFIPVREPQEPLSSSPQARFIPVGRTGLATEMGPLAVYLASDASSYTNGDLFVIDGGALASGYAPTGYAPEVPLEI